jgi:hypothetical protein
MVGYGKGVVSPFAELARNGGDSISTSSSLTA